VLTNAEREKNFKWKFTREEEAQKKREDIILTLQNIHNRAAAFSPRRRNGEAVKLFTFRI